MSGADRPHFKRTPLPGNQRIGSPIFHNPKSRLFETLDPLTVVTYFKNHPKSLDEIILGLSTKKIQWLIQKSQSFTPDEIIFEHAPVRKHNRPNPLLSIKTQSETFLKESRESDLPKLLFSTAEVLARTLKVDWFSLYLPCNKNKGLCEYTTDGHKKLYGPIGKGTTVSAEAASVGSTLLVENLPRDPKFPEGVGHPERDVYFVLSIPLVFPSGDLIGVIELCKDPLKDPFSEDDLRITNSLLGWMVSSLHQASINRIITLQSKLVDFLLDATKELLLDDMVSIDKLVENILLFCKDLVHADRCVMFLVNEDQNELYADYFHEGLTEDGKKMFSTQKQIRFSSDKGIVGYVYKTGEAANVADTYRDPRFNPDVDEVTGYQTRNALAYPIMCKSKVVGVIEMINRRSNDHFTLADENALKTYAVYCALALHNSRIYNELHRSQNRYKIAMEVLKYHIIAQGEDCEVLKEDTPSEIIPEAIVKFDLITFELEKDLPQLFIYIIHDLFGKDTFNFSKLSRFILTVRKNYRPVSYHNWNHGFKVAHSLYCMLKTNPNIFTTLEQIALVIGGICHDLDHRGYNNVFYQKFNLPLADLYSTSVMEQHHFKHTLTILQLEDHDIFSFLSCHDYKVMIEEIRENIISTDLSLYFGRKKILSNMINTKAYDVMKKQCRDLCKAMMMTGADLCAVALPWDSQLQIVECIYDEFYTQGDMEKEKGLKPIEIMDRDFEDDKPRQQVGFILFICKPLYTTIREILPGCQPLLDGTEVNLKHWQRLAFEITKTPEGKMEREERERKKQEKKEREQNEAEEKKNNEKKQEREENEEKSKQEKENKEENKEEGGKGEREVMKEEIKEENEEEMKDWID